MEVNFKFTNHMVFAVRGVAMSEKLSARLMKTEEKILHTN